MQDGAAWSGARASTWEVVRPLCVPVLSLDRSAAAVVAVTGGGAALTLSASLARRPKRQRGTVAGSASASHLERREEAAAAAGALRGAAWAAKLGAVGDSAAALAASVASQTATRAMSLGVLTTSSSQMKSPPRLTKGIEKATVPSGL